MVFESVMPKFENYGSMSNMYAVLNDPQTCSGSGGGSGGGGGSSSCSSAASTSSSNWKSSRSAADCDTSIDMIAATTPLTELIDFSRHQSTETSSGIRKGIAVETAAAAAAVATPNTNLYQKLNGSVNVSLQDSPSKSFRSNHNHSNNNNNSNINNNNNNNSNSNHRNRDTIITINGSGGGDENGGSAMSSGRKDGSNGQYDGVVVQAKALALEPGISANAVTEAAAGAASAAAATTTITITNNNGSIEDNSDFQSTRAPKYSMSTSGTNDISFPDEIYKTFLAFIILSISFLMTSTSIAIIHDYVPDRHKYGPLPDVFLDHFEDKNWALTVSEYLILLSVYTTALLIFLHRHRWIVMRRVFLIMSLLYMMRAITMYVTVLPLASRTYPCDPKSNHTDFYAISKRVLSIVSGFGLSLSGKVVYCGDSIYSGHTVTLVLSYLIIAEYSPRRFFLLRWFYKCVSALGVIFVLLSHGHYTIDVIIAYYVTTRLFWTYHTLANNLTMKKHVHYNYFANEWWFRGFCYFEKNIDGIVPRRYNWPFRWPSAATTLLIRRRFNGATRDS